jgi:hypothetical protein
MSVIVRTTSNAYGARMTAALFRLVMMLLLVLMPLGMAMAPAAVQSLPAAHQVAQNGHCDERPGQDKAPAQSSQQMHCAMCAALPASTPPSPSVGLLPSTPCMIAAVSPFNGIELEIATPPPRNG